MKRSKNLLSVEHSSELPPILRSCLGLEPKDIILSFGDSHSTWITSLELHLLGNKARFMTKTGQIYLVDKISSDVLIYWAKSPSKGHFFNKFIKPNNLIYKAV